MEMQLHMLLEEQEQELIHIHGRMGHIFWIQL